MNLLGVNDNAKSRKTKGEWLIGALSLAPAETSGVTNVCPFATPICSANCLITSGRNRMSNATNARMRKTRLMWFDPKEFRRQLVEDLFALERRGFKQRKKTACRLNQYSDIAWERKLQLETWDIQFYDYTKIPARYSAWLNGGREFKCESSGNPLNYFLTFSLSENNANIARGFLDQGGTVAAVYGTERPDTWHGFPVIDGDENDLRFLDPPGVVVGLKAKGSMKSQPAFWMENL